MVEMLVVVAIILTIVSALTLPGIWKAYDRAVDVAEGKQGTGLTGAYYTGSPANGGLFNTLVTTRTDAKINFTDLGSGLPAGMPTTDISIKWSGMIRADEEGTYTIEPRTDDGVDLIINGRQLVSDINSIHGMQAFPVQIQLDAGDHATIEMHYQQGTGGAGAELYWSGPGFSRQFIPTEHLYPVEQVGEANIQGYNRKLERVIDLSKNVRYTR